ncbi:DNA pilot protein [Peromfec virus RodF8_8]|uniref:DNA pilot protein n=1 Tax=Peromfec virus RodF8_8 TaxID=2929389 RepID=A0A976R8A7_9VIRU|nr:DNA pilot protein [Peromfec virus RodF8_8]
MRPFFSIMGFFNDVLNGIGKAFKTVTGLPAAIGGVIEGGLNLIGNNQTNKYNAHIADRTNQANAALQQQNLEWQEAMQDKQNQWNLDQWNRENEYNSAAAQVQRYNEAGINPALAMAGAGSVGQASSLQSASPASPQALPDRVTPQMQSGWSAAGNAIGNAMSQIAGFVYDAPKQAAEIQGMQAQQRYIDDLTKDGYIRRTGMNLDNSIKGWRDVQSKWDLHSARQNFEFNDKMNQLKLKSADLQNKYTDALTINASLDGSAKMIANKYLDTQTQNEIAMSNAEIANLWFSLNKGKKELPYILDNLDREIALNTQRIVNEGYEQGYWQKWSKEDLEEYSKAQLRAVVSNSWKSYYDWQSAVNSYEVGKVDADWIKENPGFYKYGKTFDTVSGTLDALGGFWNLGNNSYSNYINNKRVRESLKSESEEIKSYDSRGRFKGSKVRTRSRH